MSYHIVFLDIDGTILQKDDTICPSTKEAIHQLHQQGIHVFLATGRPVRGILELASTLNIHSYIGYNGAYGLHQNELIVNELMGRHTITQFINTAKKHEHEMVLYTDGSNYYTSPHGKATKQFQKKFQLQQSKSYTEQTLDHVLSATILNVDPDQKKKYEFNPDVRLAQLNIDGLEHSYDVLRVNVNKGTAVKAVLNKLNIPADKAVAFGDGLNDKEMFQSVGASFVMADGHEDVFPYAKYQTTSASEKGIFKGLKQIGLVE